MAIRAPMLLLAMLAAAVFANGRRQQMLSLSSPGGRQQRRPLSFPARHHARELRPRGKEDADEEAISLTTVEFEVELVLEGISCDTVELLLAQGIARGKSADIILGRIICSALEDQLSASGNFPLSLLAGCAAEGTTIASGCPGLDLLTTAETRASTTETKEIVKHRGEKYLVINDWSDDLEELITNWPPIWTGDVATKTFKDRVGQNRHLQGQFLRIKGMMTAAYRGIGDSLLGGSEAGGETNESGAQSTLVSFAQTLTTAIANVVAGSESIAGSNAREGSTFLSEAIVEALPGLPPAAAAEVAAAATESVASVDSDVVFAVVETTAAAIFAATEATAGDEAASPAETVAEFVIAVAEVSEAVATVMTENVAQAEVAAETVAAETVAAAETGPVVAPPGGPPPTVPPPPSPVDDAFTTVDTYLCGSTDDKQKLTKTHGPIKSWTFADTVTTFQHLFSKARAVGGDCVASDYQDFNTDISGWVYPGVTNMVEMFEDATAFNKNLASWDVSKVTNMEGMFSGASAFNQDISTWAVGEVTNMNSMFNAATTFNQAISGWNVAKVTDMKNMFLTATSFNQNLSTWNAGEVTTMLGMFSGASSFVGPIFTSVAKVTDMSYMFYLATSFNQDISTWAVGEVTTMRSMFEGATSFDSAIFTGTDKVTTMRQMFRQASSFNKDVSSMAVASVTNMNEMFFNATAFKQDLCAWGPAMSSTPPSVVSMFGDSGCTGDGYSGSSPDFTSSPPAHFCKTACAMITSANNAIDSYLCGDTTSGLASKADTLATYGPIKDWTFDPSLTSFVQLFDAVVCTPRSLYHDFNEDISGWTFPGVTNMRLMFKGVTSFNQNLASWDVSKVTNMESMFRGALSFNQNIASWDVSKVTNMQFMFYGKGKGTSSFNQNLASWDVSKVVNMNSMFRDAKSFNQNLASWDVSKVTNMQFMFFGATLFNQDLCALGTHLLATPTISAVNMENMFSDTSCGSSSNPVISSFVSPLCSVCTSS